MEKLTTFYQKLLQNLAKEYANDDFRGHTHFIQTYEMVADTLYGFSPNCFKFHKFYERNS